MTSPVHPTLLRQARHLMRACDFTLREASQAVGVTARDLDLALWRYVGDLPKFTWRD